MKTLALLSAIVLAASTLATMSTACPPGLAKKNPPCVPPGQAKKGYDYGTQRYGSDKVHVFRQGEILPGGYIFIHDPQRYGLRDGGSYVRLGDYVYRIDRETREVLNLIGAVAAILN